MSYIRVSLQGSLPGGEVFSINPAFSETTDVVTWDQAEGQAAALAIGAIALPSALLTIKGTIAAGTVVRVERRSDAGVLLGAAESPWLGGQGGSQPAAHPPQTSIVLSLRSNIPGSRGRGRLYFPALGATLSATTLRLTAPTTAAVATAAVNYLDSVATALKNAFHPTPSLIDLDLCVVSPTYGSKVIVERIEVGDILDVQRRRRDRMQEVYASADMP